MSDVLSEHPVGIVNIFVPGFVVKCLLELLHDSINECSIVEDIMNFPIDAAILGD